MRFFGYTILRFGIFLLIQIMAVDAHANDVDVQLLKDTSKTNKDTIHLVASINSKDRLEDMMDDSIENELLDSGNTFLLKDIKQNALLHFIESDRLKNDVHNVRGAKRIYSKLAKIFARMKYYPIAMQYYYEALPDSQWRYFPEDTSENNEPVSNRFNFADNNIVNAANNNIRDAEGQLVPKFLSNSFQQTYLNNSQSYFLCRKGTENNSESIKEYNISEAFKDGKDAVAYAIMVHIKQPATGKRKAFTGINNVGHTFITLLKYNSDSTCVSHSFGFYPQKNNFLSATPLHPASPSVFKDDTVHDWDEAVGKFISERRFKKLIRLIAKFEGRKYNLNSNNCTDFGLYAAGVAGISISNTVGTWPLGHGNNPANAGQSILEGKFINTDTGNTQGLFICASQNKIERKGL